MLDRAYPSQDFWRLQDEQAKRALSEFLHDVERMQRDILPAGVGGVRPSYQSIQPQVFFSYAYGDINDFIFQWFRGFLEMLREDFIKAGVGVWLDAFNMIGHLEDQMREGINGSNVTLLMGTKIYARKTQINSPANVNKELNLCLQRPRDTMAHCLIPLLLEGRYENTFPRLGYQFLMPDATSWMDLRNCNFQMLGYVKTLTDLAPVGLLPAALGFHRPDYPHAGFKQNYRTAQELLMRNLEEIYRINDPLLEFGNRFQRMEQQLLMQNHANYNREIPEALNVAAPAEVSSPLTIDLEKQPSLGISKKVVFGASVATKMLHAFNESRFSGKLLSSVEGHIATRSTTAVPCMVDGASIVSDCKRKGNMIISAGIGLTVLYCLYKLSKNFKKKGIDEEVSERQDFRPV